MEIRLAGLVNDSIVDGPGFRLTVFTQGCPHDCPGCHNPETHDFGGGKMYDVEKVIETFRENILLDGVTFSGGDPFCQSDKCAVIARAAKESGIGYGSINHPVDRDPICGFNGIIGDKCPKCNREEGTVHFERIRRITGYLVGTMDRWNSAKRAEEADRVKHSVKD